MGFGMCGDLFISSDIDRFAAAGRVCGSVEDLEDETQELLLLFAA